MEKTFYERLRIDLLRGRFRSGEWLKQADLESQYAATRSEVRAALTELATRQLVEHVPNRGYRVVNHNDAQREHLYETRVIVETGAARLVVSRATDADIEKFAALVEAFDVAADRADHAKLRDINWQLHDVFYRFSGNDLLADEIRELRERGTFGNTGTWSTLAGIRASSADHREMLAMLRKRDSEGLTHVIYRHLNRRREFTSQDEL
ncbi:GntR family transcriptional regulator [Steroidobacter sp.]|uniref:GntR family transcriptional regulator n=1 Tax=Steroidobacter sp. TaxID=1978227 RepID=UPI001A4FD1D0|nr:GntR family transcriptional regulator [Steroidobacter sp.]MBL8271653.1 GntR family transcriptional regulator [Steroidobacter sp.]